MTASRPISFLLQQPGRRRRIERETVDPESGFDMANLYPRTTGLPRTVWISPRMGQHDARIKVALTPGEKMIADETVNVLLRPKIRQRDDEEQLPRSVMRAVTRWAKLNQAALMDFWNGEIDSAEFHRRHQKV
jgi:hypothetical protein